MKNVRFNFCKADEGQKQLDVKGVHGAFMAPATFRAAEVYASMEGRHCNCKNIAEDKRETCPICFDQFWLYKIVRLDVWLHIAFLCSYYIYATEAKRKQSASEANRVAKTISL